MHDMFVKQWDMVLEEETVGQSCTEFHEFKWYIYLVMDEHWNVSLRNVCHFWLISTPPPPKKKKKQKKKDQILQKYQ